ncbi:MAG: fatty acid--CoA ligase [Chthonomonadaceae bacterium]|nr:fatty acid--CoA ligase [Chthonomonadaceae bacterium]
MTWDEFSYRSHRAAGFLRELGIQKGDRVAVWMLNSHAYLEMYYATAIAGIVIVPLNTHWHADDVADTLKDSDAVALVVDDRFVLAAENVPHPQYVIYAGNGMCPSGMMAYGYSGVSHTFEEPDAEDLVGLFYTSGTTGGPKGVMLTHRNVWSNGLHAIISAGMDPTVWLHAAPMFHLADQGVLYTVAGSGAANVFLPSFEPEAFQQAVESHHVTATALVPTMLTLLLNHTSFGRYDLSSLKTLYYGASPMPLPLLRAAMQKLPTTQFRQEYGMTETSPLITALTHEEHFGQAVASVGKPALGVEVRVVDDRDHDVPIGESGEIITRGANVMKGYWNRPEITAEVLRGGWMHTGDIGKFDRDGFLYILDRKKDMIKPGGENVYSPEVEAMILSHPAVIETAVIGVPDPKWGEAIRAVVVRCPGSKLTENELIEWCRERMTHFKCPSSVVFIDTLPKNGAGKVQKSVLRSSQL